MDRDHCCFHRGGLIFEGKCIFENKPPPQSRSCLLLKKGGGLIFGRIRYIHKHAGMHVGVAHAHLSCLRARADVW